MWVAWGAIDLDSHIPRRNPRFEVTRDVAESSGGTARAQQTVRRSQCALLGVSLHVQGSLVRRFRLPAARRQLRSVCPSPARGRLRYARFGVLARRRPRHRCGCRVTTFVIPYVVGETLFARIRFVAIIDRARELFECLNCFLDRMWTFVSTRS